MPQLRYDDGDFPLPFIDRLDEYYQMGQRVDWSPYPPFTLRDLDMCASLEHVRDQYDWAFGWTMQPEFKAKLVASIYAMAQSWNMRDIDWQYVLKEL
ncbi:hypothetical protein GGF32_007223 [Allomyces javanicus]|nr:hypothetical protein GGF32_007223 [Allomyces javanicus]